MISRPVNLPLWLIMPTKKNTHIVRGQDLLNSTPEQIYLQRTLDFTTPQYAHLALVLDKDGHKLSKSLAACPDSPADPDPTPRLACAQPGNSLSSARSVGRTNTGLNMRFFTRPSNFVLEKFRHLHNCQRHNSFRAPDHLHQFR